MPKKQNNFAYPGGPNPSPGNPPRGNDAVTKNIKVN